MKQIIQAIFASLLLLVVGISFCACDEEDWHADTETILTDADHGSLTNGRVVATGIVKNVTHNSATILCSANYNYKESLNIQPGIVYSDKTYGSGSYNYLQITDKYSTCVNITNFTQSTCEVTVSNLKPNTTYYYRAYAPAPGFSSEHYGDIKSFRTSMDNSVGDAVDLGLSVKWASKNIGASQLEEEGSKFYWGAIDACETNYHADWHDYSITTLVARGYLDGNNNLSPSYDAATRIWGSKWRMPTERECRELITQCTWKSTTKNGEKVYLVTGPNGNVIYLPSDYTYWTSTANQYDSYYLECYSSYYGWRTMTTTSRNVLKSIRPVMDK